jgi:thiol-disulfide isomerase/thioredoxin
MPSSYQNAAPGSKSMKFADAMDPFAGFLGRENADNSDDVISSSAVLSEQLDTRLRVSSHPSTLSAAASPQSQMMTMQQQEQAVASEVSQNTTVPATTFNKHETTLKQEDDSDSDLEEFDDDDAVLEAIRQKRLAQLKHAHAKLDAQNAKGHGQVRVISQDEFLPECMSSRFVVVHFFHKEFERCNILSHHLKKLANAHLNCKFVEIDAEKAPFFVVKLKVQTLPTMIVFKDGKAVNRLVGFEDLMTASDNNTTINEFPTSRLGYWLEQTGAIEYDGPESDEEKDENVSKSRTSGSHRFKVYDDDGV